MKLLLSIILTLLSLTVYKPDIYISNDGKLTFYSYAPVEDIFATTEKVGSALNIKTGKIVFKIPINTFQFKNKLMQEHFNENYLESEKYPFGTFIGQVIGPIDASATGAVAYNIEGELKIHGVSQQRKIHGTLEFIDGKIIGHSEFKIKVVDHKIKIPQVIFYNIAEEIMIKLDIEYKPKGE